MSVSQIDRAIEKKLDTMKKQLLDTGKRNRMINYRETKRATLRIISPAYAELFNRIALKEESLSFQRPLDQDTDSRAYYFLEFMKTLGHEIFVRLGDIETGATTAGDQKTTLRNLRSKARLAQEEQGTNILYLSFGFIKWRENNHNSTPWMMSPIIMVPAALTIKSINAPFILSRYDDDIVVNPTLAYKFENEFNITLPEFEAVDEKSLDKYFTKIEKIADEHGWQLIREVSLGLVSFLKISMYFDLERKHDLLMSNPVIRAMCGDTNAVVFPEKAKNGIVLDSIKPIDQYEVIDADSSQQKAIQLSKMGVSFVMQGPPGTGKSQTITNIIAQALADGKKVLFVSEKAAALDVVYRRLTEAHISDFCLSLHDYKANKRDVLKQIGQNLHLKKITVKSAAMNNLIRLSQRRNELNQYAQELHEVIQPLNISLYQVFGEMAQFTEPVDFICKIDNAEKVSESDFQLMNYNAERYVRTIKEMSCDLHANPWKGTTVSTTSTMYLTDLKKRTEGLSERLRELEAIISQPLGPLCYKNVSMQKVKEYMEMLAIAKDIPLHDYSLHQLSVPDRKRMLLAAKKARLAQTTYQNALYECCRYFDDSIMEAPVEQWLQQFQGFADQIKCYSGWQLITSETIYSTLEQIIHEAKQADDKLRSVLPALRKIRNMAGLPESNESMYLSEAKTVIEKCRSILNLSDVPLKCWLTKQGSEIAEQLIIYACQAIRDRNQTNREVEKQWQSSVYKYTADWINKQCIEPVTQITKEIDDQPSPLIVEWLDELVAVANRSRTILRNMISANNAIAALFGLEVHNSWGQVLSIIQISKLLIESEGVLPSWLNPVRREDAKKLLEESMVHAKQYTDKLSVLEKEWQKGIIDLDIHAILNRFKHTYTGLFGRLKPQYKTDKQAIVSFARNKSAAYSDDQLMQALRKAREVKDEKQWMQANEDRLKGLLGYHYQGIESNWEMIREKLEQSDKLSAELAFMMEPDEASFIAVLGDEKKFSEVRNAYQKNLSEELIGELANDLARFVEIRLNNPKGLTYSLKQLMDIEQKCIVVAGSIRELASEHISDNQDLTIDQVMEIFRVIKADEEYQQWFVNRLDDIKVYTEGDDYDNEQFWEKQIKRLKEAVQVQKAFGDQLTDMLRDCLAEENSLKRLQGISGAIVEEYTEEELSKCVQLCMVYEPVGKTSVTVADLVEGMETVRHSAEQIQQLIMECNIYALFDLSADMLPVKLREVEKAKQIKREYSTIMAQNPVLIQQFGCRDDWSDIIAILEYMNALTAEGSMKQFTPEFIEFFCDNPEARKEIAQRLEKLTQIYVIVEPEVRELASIFPEETDLDQRPVYVIADKYDQCMDHIEMLDMWLNYQDAKQECIRTGLSDFVENMEKRDGKVRDAVGCFRYSFFARWCQIIIGSKQSVSRFKRMSQEETVREFCDLDVSQFATAQQRIRAKIIDTFPDPNVATAAGDEMSILTKELQKKQKIMPLRKLFREIPNLLLILKPCLMMSPLSVSYFLEADSYQFDMIIFDEASQIFPQDALGSIMRGKQVIIAGDTKQLPPTNFFATSTINTDSDYDDEEDEDVLEEEISDSILEEADRALSSSTLLWHYRSRNEQLIAFSNQEIYDNRLITFPGCRDHMIDTGVEFIHVKDGLYEGKPKNCNVIEAQKCVELIEEHIRKYKDRSLGIIAFSEKQQQAILDAVQDFREEHPIYEDFFREDKQDAFFVKNLENVQGDERDTIFFSVGYGFTKEQRERNRPMALRFGPLGRSGGERRLNVAITRAKINIKLIASFLPKDINLEKTQSVGIKMLHDYLRFAREGTDALHLPADEEDRELMCSIIKDFLIDNGYKVKERLGCSGYKVDLAVEHPSVPDCYLAIIECDGNSFAHSQTARERERLHREVLEHMGWRILRVWSTEWAKNPKIEGNRLLEFLREAERQPFEYKAKTAQQSDTTEFNDLVDEVERERGTQSTNPYGFDTYEVASLYDTPPSRRGYSVTLIDHILYVVSIEQPISMDLLCQRLAPFLNPSTYRVTTRVTSAVKSAVISLRGKIVETDGFLTLKEFRNPIVRIPAEGDEQRSINNIAPIELMEAMRTVAEKSFGLNREGLVNETARALGYSRKGTRIQTVLEDIFRQLVEKKIIHMVDGKVHAVEVSIYG